MGEPGLSGPPGIPGPTGPKVTFALDQRSPIFRIYLITITAKVTFILTCESPGCAIYNIDG